MKDYNMPEEPFWLGSPEATKENHLKHLESAVLGELVERFDRCKTPEARQHFQGCARRLLMMQHARLEIAEAWHDDAKPLNPYESNHLNICLNSYYLNLLGALDNLAWIATYELSLKSVIDETSEETRRFCTPTNKKFNAALETVNPLLQAHVAAAEPWIQELKKFRDPAAHRLPLSIVPGIMSPEEGERYTELQQQSHAAYLADRWQEAEKLMAEAEALGAFVPLLEGPRGPNNGIYIVPRQLASEQRRFLDFTHRFVELLV